MAGKVSVEVCCPFSFATMPENQSYVDCFPWQLGLVRWLLRNFAKFLAGNRPPGKWKRGCTAHNGPAQATISCSYWLIQCTSTCPIFCPRFMLWLYSPRSLCVADVSHWQFAGSGTSPPPNSPVPHSNRYHPELRAIAAFTATQLTLPSCRRSLFVRPSSQSPALGPRC